MLGSTYRLWMKLTAPLRIVISTLMLAALYYLLLLPLALVWRWTRAAPDDRRFSPELDSYWVAHPSADDPERYFRRY